MPLSRILTCALRIFSNSRIKAFFIHSTTQRVVGNPQLLPIENHANAPISQPKPSQLSRNSSPKSEILSRALSTQQKQHQRLTVKSGSARASTSLSFSRVPFRRCKTFSARPIPSGGPTVRYAYTHTSARINTHRGPKWLNVPAASRSDRLSRRERHAAVAAAAAMPSKFNHLASERTP
jgi:hypothetical protein